MVDHSELFDNYLKGRLSENENASFEGRLETDHAFNEEYNTYRLLVAGIIETGKADLKEKLVKHEQLKHAPVKKSYFYYKIAAAVLILITISFLILHNSRLTNYQTIYADYYEPYPNIIDPIDRSTSYDEYSIYQLYELKKFEEVVKRLSSGEQKATLSDVELFYLGQSYLGLKNFGLAISNLQKISSESDFHITAKWYMALAYVKMKNYDEAKSILNQLIIKNGDYAKRAQKIKNLL